MSGKLIVISGATGVLAGEMADYLAASGAWVAFVGRDRAKLDHALARCLLRTPDADVDGYLADVLDRPALQRVRDDVLKRFGRIDSLINAAGGNQPGATITPEKTFADLDFSAFEQVVDLNLHGTVLPTLVIAPAMKAGSIVNISSASAAQAITRVVGYSAAKSAVDNFTRWLAVEMGRRRGGAIRVNAIVPGFFPG